MKKLGKRLIVVFLVIAMVVASFTACKKDDKDNEAGSKSAKSSDEKITLEFWHITTDDPMKSNIQDSMDRYMADHPNVTIKVTPVANDAYKDKLAIAMNSNTVPDMFLTWGGGTLNEYIDADRVYDITEFMNKDNYKDKFLDASIAQISYKDKIWGLPVENITIAGFFYNKEIFAKYNLEEPKTIADLEAICETLKSNGITPFTLANATQWTGSMYYMYLAARKGGLDPFNNAFAGTGSFEDECFKYAGEKIQEWVKKGYFNEGFNGMDDDSGQARQLLYTGAAAMDLMGSWFPSTVNSEMPDFLNNNLGFFEFPAVAADDANAKIAIGTIGDNFYCVSKSCKNPEAAFDALTYLIDDTAVEKRVAAGKMPPIKSYVPEGDLYKEIIAAANGASSTQLWYDQYLPPAVADVHKKTSQEIFGLTMTPEEADKALQDAMQAYLKK